MLKPILDGIAATLLLIPALPIIGICWVLVRLTSSGPGFYCQTRAGLNGRPYRMVKLRTMRHNCERTSGIVWSVNGDSRITLIGRFLRVTHFDELPQLFNVLRGEMSLVGPRPERPEIIRAKGLMDLVPGYEHRLDVRPGVTGIAQVQLPADSDLASVRHKVAYDLYAIAHGGFWLDVRVFAATLLKTVGASPELCRRLCRLPSREQVEEALVDLTQPANPCSPAPSGLFQIV